MELNHMQKIKIKQLDHLVNEILDLRHQSKSILNPVEQGLFMSMTRIAKIAMDEMCGEQSLDDYLLEKLTTIKESVSEQHNPNITKSPHSR